MKFSIPQLQKYKTEPLIIDGQIDIKDEILKRFPDRLINISQVKIAGQIEYLKNDRINISLNINTTATVLSNIELKSIDLPLDFNIEEIYVQDEETLNTYALTDQVFLVENNQIDIDEIVIENIIIELPIVVDDDSNQKEGSGWQIIDEEEFIETNKKDDTQTLGEFFPEDDAD